MFWCEGKIGRIVLPLVFEVSFSGRTVSLSEEELLGAKELFLHRCCLAACKNSKLANEIPCCAVVCIRRVAHCRLRNPCEDKSRISFRSKSSPRTMLSTLRSSSRTVSRSVLARRTLAPAADRRSRAFSSFVWERHPSPSPRIRSRSPGFATNHASKRKGSPVGSRHAPIFVGSTVGEIGSGKAIRRLFSSSGLSRSSHRAGAAAGAAAQQLTFNEAMMSSANYHAQAAAEAAKGYAEVGHRVYRRSNQTKIKYEKDLGTTNVLVGGQVVLLLCAISHRSPQIEHQEEIEILMIYKRRG